VALYCLKILKAFEMCIWHHMLKISWMEHRKNDELKQEENYWIC